MIEQDDSSQPGKVTLPTSPAGLPPPLPRGSSVPPTPLSRGARGIRGVTGPTRALLGVAVSVGVVSAAVLVFVGPDAPISTPSTMIQDCEAASQDTEERIAQALEGSPPPRIGATATARFKVGASDGRIVAIRFEGAGVDGEVAIFAIGGGNFYAVDGYARSFSKFPNLAIASSWKKEIDWVKSCLPP
jgi:hypothetical protein